MILNLLVLGFFLSLDNFRTSVLLGPLGFRWRRAAEISAVFGFFDGLAPLVGILLGDYVSRQIGGPISDIVGPTVLGVYGAYLIVQALRTTEQEALEELHRWSIFGLPLPLSLDNVVAGTGLGLVGLSPLVPAVLFAAITAVMSFAGLQLGRLASHFIPLRIRWDLVTGVALIIEAIVFGLGLVS